MLAATSQERRRAGSVSWIHTPRQNYIAVSLGFLQSRAYLTLCPQIRGQRTLAEDIIPNVLTCRMLVSRLLCVKVMRTYMIRRISGKDWRAYVGAPSFVIVETGDRRAARKIVRLSRRLGYADIGFWEVKRLGGQL